MHISSEKQHPLTKCTKMSEELHKFGMNGNVDKSIKEESVKSSYGHGGRLKFFKDGKFILELERAREGERVSWVSVPRKTFWPPQGTATTTPAYRQESSTSLSVSDDNSSIQSSPWQRDHSWKQTNPTKNISKELRFYYWRPKQLRTNKPSKHARKSRKNPKRTLLIVIQSLIDKNLRTTTPPRSESVVSPRKRFLREMEKDRALNDDMSINSDKKRSRNKVQTSGSSSNGDDTNKLRNSSYSITSLLSEDRNNVKRSPTSSPSHYPNSMPPQYSNTEDRWYSESVDRLRSIELSQVEKGVGYPPYPQQSYLHNYMYPFGPPAPVAPYYNYNRGYIMPSMYHNGTPIHLPIRHDAPASYATWTTETRRDAERREETVTDMPLNLSKNSG